jgi:hypothetical protein
VRLLCEGTQGYLGASCRKVKSSQSLEVTCANTASLRLFTPSHVLPKRTEWHPCHNQQLCREAIARVCGRERWCRLRPSTRW